MFLKLFIKHIANAAKKSFDISSMGELALQSHMKGIFISLFLPCVKGSERGRLEQFFEH
jgi:hypothetical protein